MNVLIETADQELAKEHLDGEDFAVFTKSNFGGEMEIFAFLLGLTPLIVDKVFSLYLAHVEANKHIKIKVDGIEITGLPKEEALELLNDLSGEQKSAD